MIELDNQFKSMRDAGALFILNDSGGKDSQAMRILIQGEVPRNQLIVMHATLGEAEWPGALEHAQCGARSNGIDFRVAAATKTFFEMVEHRFRTRPDAPCWPSAKHRQCTSDLKRGPLEREIRRESAKRGMPLIINCMGIRSAESPARSKLTTKKYNTRNSKAGRRWWDWLPIHALSRDEVFQTIADAGEEPHYAYALGNERLSCMFCIMGSRNDLRNAAIQNPALYRRYVETERRTGYTMHQSRVSLPVLTGVEVAA